MPSDDRHIGEHTLLRKGNEQFHKTRGDERRQWVKPPLFAWGGRALLPRRERAGSRQVKASAAFPSGRLARTAAYKAFSLCIS